MEIVYVILAHKHPQQLIRLVERLNTNKTYFLLHIDRKAGFDLYQEASKELSKYSNVFFLKRKNCYWGNFSQVAITMDGINTIFENNISFDYVKFLTGQCYPIKSNQQIKSFLEQSDSCSFIASFPLPSDTWIKGGEKRGGMDRIEYFHFNLFHKHFYTSFFKRKFPQGFQPFGGSAYWCLSQELAEYIYYFVKNNSSFISFFNNVVCPDEIFFQTIIMNSPFKARTINSDLTYTLWTDSSDHPEILGANHFDALTQSPCLFARKFDVNVDPTILNLLDE